MTTPTLSRSYASNGIAYHLTGEGSPVVLVHGVGLRAESFAPQIEFLKSSHKIYAIDMPGHGKSAGFKSADPNLGDYTTRLEGFIDGVIGEPVLLVGHSMGAMIALEFIRAHPQKCYGVATLNSVYSRSCEASLAIKQRAVALFHDPQDDLASAPTKRWFGDAPTGHCLEISNLCKQWLTQVDRQGYAAAYSVFANNDGLRDEQLAQLQLPVLFLTGEVDTNSTPEMSISMSCLAPGGEVMIIPDAGHLAQLTHAEQVNSALGSFFARCDSNKIDQKNKTGFR